MTHSYWHRCINLPLLLLAWSTCTSWANAQFPPEPDLAVAARKKIDNLILEISGTIQEAKETDEYRSKLWLSGEALREDRFRQRKDEDKSLEYREIHCATPAHKIFWSDVRPNIGVAVYDQEKWTGNSAARPIDLRCLGMNEGGVFAASREETSIDSCLPNRSPQAFLGLKTERADGKVEMRFRLVGSEADGRMVFDVAAGGSISLIEFRSKFGYSRTEMVTFHKLHDGNYFPKTLAFTRGRFAAVDGKRTEEPASLGKWKIEVVSDGKPIPKDIFDLSGMGIPIGKGVHMFDGTGRELFWDGKELVKERPPVEKEP